MGETPKRLAGLKVVDLGTLIDDWCAGLDEAAMASSRVDSAV